MTEQIQDLCERLQENPRDEETFDKLYEEARRLIQELVKRD